jgi:hypothetical protein
MNLGRNRNRKGKGVEERAGTGCWVAGAKYGDGFSKLAPNEKETMDFRKNALKIVEASL